MKLLGKLTLFLGGLLTMTTLQACGPADPSVSNRTVEQYNLEKEFQPLFDFLAQEKKDFSDVKLYYSHYSIRQMDGTQHTSYDADFKKIGKNLSGVYKIEVDGQVTEQPIGINDEGRIIYESPVSQGYDEDLFHFKLSKEFFQNLSISDYTAKHPKTYLKDISYDVDKEKSRHFKQLIDTYQLSDDSDITLYLTSHYIQNDLVFDVNLIISDNHKIFSLQNIVGFS